MNKLERFNDRLAVLMTKAMNSVWMFYVFFIVSALPIHYTDYKEVYHYFVEFISLVFLPIIMVGQRIMGRAGQIRAHEDHLTLQKMVKETQEELALLREHVIQKKEDPST